MLVYICQLITSTDVFQSLYILLSQVQTVLGGTPNFKEALLLDSPFSISLSAIQISFRAFYENKTEGIKNTCFCAIVDCSNKKI